MGGDLLESLAAFGAAYAAKRIEDEAWQLTEADVLDATRRVHAVGWKISGRGDRMTREVHERSIPAEQRWATGPRASCSSTPASCTPRTWPG